MALAKAESMALGYEVGQIANTLVNEFGDMSMVSRLGPTALAATGMGSLLLWVIMSMSVGIRTGVQTITARRLGEQKYKLCTINEGEP